MINEKQKKYLDELWDNFYKINNNFSEAEKVSKQEICECVFEFIGDMHMQDYLEKDQIEGNLKK